MFPTNTKLQCEKCGSVYFQPADFREFHSGYSANPGGELCSDVHSRLRRAVSRSLRKLEVRKEGGPKFGPPSFFARLDITDAVSVQSVRNQMRAIYSDHRKAHPLIKSTNPGYQKKVVKLQ